MTVSKTKKDTGSRSLERRLNQPEAPACGLYKRHMEPEWREYKMVGWFCPSCYKR